MKYSLFIYLLNYLSLIVRYLVKSLSGTSLAVDNILPRAQASIESDGGTFEYKLKSFKKRQSIIPYYGFFPLKCSTSDNTNNILITV